MSCTLNLEFVLLFGDWSIIHTTYIFIGHTIHMSEKSEKEGLGLALPLINSIIVNKQFINLGHVYQDKKRERRKLDESAILLEARVKELERQEKMTKKQIDSQQKQLEDLLAIRERQHQELMAKKWHERVQNIKLNNLKQQSSEQRHQHKNNLSSAMGERYKQNHEEYIDGRQSMRSRESQKRQMDQLLLAQKQEMRSRIHQEKHDGKIKVIEFKKERNKEHIDEYHDRILSEQERKLQRIKQMQELEQKETMILQRLQQSSQKHLLMQDRINSASQMPLEELQSLVRSQRKPRHLSSSGSSRGSLLSGKSADVLMLPSLSRNPAKSNPEDVQNYRAKLSQISHTVQILDKPKMQEIEISNKVKEELKSPYSPSAESTADKKSKAKTAKKRKAKANVQKSIDLYLG